MKEGKERDEKNVLRAARIASNAFNLKKEGERIDSDITHTKIKNVPMTTGKPSSPASSRWHHPVGK